MSGSASAGGCNSPRRLTQPARARAPNQRMGDQHSLKNGTQPTSTRQTSTPSTPGPAPTQRSRPRRAAEDREAAALVGDKLRESASSPSFKSQFYTSLLANLDHALAFHRKPVSHTYPLGDSERKLPEHSDHERQFVHLVGPLVESLGK